MDLIIWIVRNCYEVLGALIKLVRKEEESGGHRELFLMTGVKRGC